jgi:hypothetical protein
MPSIFDTDKGARWPRSQKFSLSDSGSRAEQDYREVITASRSDAGRASFDAARKLWAGALQVEPDDGMYLGELRAGPRTLDELWRALETCGKSRTDLKAAIRRLTAVGLVLAVAPPPASDGSRSWR